MIKKYSEEYFENRIKFLQESLREQLPEINDGAKNIFLNACQSVQSAFSAKAKAQDLLEHLQKQKADQGLIDEASAVVESCEAVLETAQYTMMDSARPILESLHLSKCLDEAIFLECTVLARSTAKGLAKWVASKLPLLVLLLHLTQLHPKLLVVAIIMSYEYDTTRNAYEYCTTSYS